MNGGVAALAVFDDGGGPALYAGGAFTSADGTAANHVARWDGVSWSALGGGTSSTVETLAAFDLGDGVGPALLAGGPFEVVPDSGDGYLARWGRRSGPDVGVVPPPADGLDR